MEVEPTGQRGRMSAACGQNVLETKNGNFRKPSDTEPWILLVNVKRKSQAAYGLRWSSLTPNHRKGPKWRGPKWWMHIVSRPSGRCRLMVVITRKDCKVQNLTILHRHSAMYIQWHFHVCRSQVGLCRSVRKERETARITRYRHLHHFCNRQMTSRV